MIPKLYNDGIPRLQGFIIGDFTLFMGFDGAVFEHTVCQPWHRGFAVLADDSMECYRFHGDDFIGTLYGYSKLSESERVYKKGMGGFVVYGDSEALRMLIQMQINRFGEVCRGAVTDGTAMEGMGAAGFLVGKVSLGLGHMAGDAALFGISLFDLEVTDHKAVAALFVRVAPHTAFTRIVPLVAVVDIVVGGAGGFGKESEKAALLFENDLLPLFFRVCREEIFLFLRILVLIRFGMLLYIFDLMTSLAGDRFGLLDRVVMQPALACDKIMVRGRMALGTAVVSFGFGGMSVPDSLVQSIFEDRAVGVDGVLVLFVDLWMAGLAGTVFQSSCCADCDTEGEEEM